MRKTLKATRSTWCKYFDERLYTSYVGYKVKQYKMEFNIRNLKGGKIDYQLSDEDINLILVERKLHERKEETI